MYLQEVYLKKEVSDKIDKKINDLIDKKMKSNFDRLKTVIVDNKKYYLSEDIHKIISINSKSLSFAIAEYVKDNFINLEDVKATGLSGRETKGTRRYYINDINDYVDSVIKNINI